MRIKLDENIPFAMAELLRGAGHESATAADEKLSGVDDPVLLATATKERRLLMTFDADFADIRHYPLGTHAGIVVFRLADQCWQHSGNPYGRDSGGALEKSVLLIKYGFVFFCIVELDNDSFGEFVARAVRVEPISGFVITPHALFEMKRRRLSEKVVGKVLADPDQRIEVRPGRHVLQSRVSMKGRTYLVRVFVDIEATPAEVVTAYRTSKVEKYWRNGP